MEPHITGVRFGTITVAGQPIRHDIVITHDGQIKKREKDLSKRQYGTSHVLSLAEIRATLDDDADTLIVGTGMFGRVRLAPDAQAYVEQQGCSIELRSIRQAVRLWNTSQGKVTGLFHITC